MRTADLGSLAAVAALCMALAGPLVEPAAAQAPPPEKPKATPAPDKAKAAPAPDKSKAATPRAEKATTPRSERDAARAAQRKQMLEHDALIRKKRAACLQERIEKKIPLFERPAFIRECMAR